MALLQSVNESGSVIHPVTHSWAPSGAHGRGEPNVVLDNWYASCSQPHLTIQTFLSQWSGMYIKGESV